jgi:uncharacterized membrane protein YgdD (TMEM256/DUF423 family)
MVHALLALVCVFWPSGNRLTAVAGWLSASGGLIFAGALAMIGLLDIRAMGAVAPIGGLLMISAWLVMMLAVLRSPSLND